MRRKELVSKVERLLLYDQNNDQRHSDINGRFDRLEKAVRENSWDVNLLKKGLRFPAGERIAALAEYLGVYFHDSPSIPSRVVCLKRGKPSKSARP